MIAKDIYCIGVNDHRIDLFESQYTVPNGVSYNSYVITDGKIAVMDTVDAAFTHEWLDNLETVLGGRKPDYLVIQHMEPDHSASIAVFKKNYPDTAIVATSKAFAMMHHLNLYNTWSSYAVEDDGIVVAYTSVYGNTKRAVERLISGLRANGCPNIAVYDLARCDMSAAVADAFRYGKLVLATTTYNADIFPPMRHFIEALTERNYQKRTVALIENGSWAPLAAKVMRGMLENSADITFASNTVKLLSAPDEDSNKQLDALAEELCREYLARQDETANKNDLSALFNLGYGLYVVTSNDGKKDNGLIVNTVSQVTNTPNRIAVTINKENYSHHIIKQTGIMNVNCPSTDAPFSVFETFGFQSGRTTDKFASCEPLRSDNGLVFLPKYINSFMSLKVMQYVDFDTHGMFICEITEARVISDRETMTYTYYQKHVKPKPQTEGRKGYVCKVCGYVYEGEELPEDFICPLCKHGAADFEPIG